MLPGADAAEVAGANDATAGTTAGGMAVARSR